MAYFPHIGHQFHGPDPPGALTRFANRRQAGRALAEKLSPYSAYDVVVLALPRGGVPVAFEVADALAAPLDVMVVRKLGVPGHEELAMGAVASGGVRVLNSEVAKGLGIDESTIEQVTSTQRRELERRERAYRGNRAPLEVQAKTIILIDDGLATGATMRAAITALRERQPQAVVVAVPLAPAQTCERLLAEADDVVCLLTPEPFVAIGAWYAEFDEVTDDEVRELLRLGR